MAEETTIYESGNVKITNLRAVFGTKTYSISNISAVENKQEEPSKLLPFVIFVIGLFLAIFALGDLPQISGNLFWGMLLGVAGFLMLRSIKTNYIVNVSTSSGEVKAFISQDKSAIDKIVNALNDAIIKKG